MKIFLETYLNLKITHENSPPSTTQNMDVPIHYQTIFQQPNKNFHLLFSKYKPIYCIVLFFSAKWFWNCHWVGQVFWLRPCQHATHCAWAGHIHKSMKEFNTHNNTQLPKAKLGSNENIRYDQAELVICGQYWLQYIAHQKTTSFVFLLFFKSYIYSYLWNKMSNFYGVFSKM